MRQWYVVAVLVAESGSLRGVSEQSPSTPTPLDQPAPPVEAVIDLLGVLAYAELLAFDRMAADARLAPDLRRRAVLSEMAAREIDNYARISRRLQVLGVDPEDAMRPFVAPLQEYHDQTEPKDWLEALTKAYVGDGIAADPKVANRLSMWARRLVGEALSQAQRVSAERTQLAGLIIAGIGDQAGIQALFKRLTTAHTVRMAAAGLNN